MKCRRKSRSRGLNIINAAKEGKGRGGRGVHERDHVGDWKAVPQDEERAESLEAPAAQWMDLVDGGWMLTQAVLPRQSLGPRRTALDTCGPNALDDPIHDNAGQRSVFNPTLCSPGSAHPRTCRPWLPGMCDSAAGWDDSGHGQWGRRLSLRVRLEQPASNLYDSL